MELSEETKAKLPANEALAQACLASYLTDEELARYMGELEQERSDLLADPGFKRAREWRERREDSRSKVGPLAVLLALLVGGWPAILAFVYLHWGSEHFYRNVLIYLAATGLTCLGALLSDRLRESEARTDRRAGFSLLPAERSLLRRYDELEGRLGAARAEQGNRSKKAEAREREELRERLDACVPPSLRHPETSPESQGYRHWMQANGGRTPLQAHKRDRSICPRCGSHDTEVEGTEQGWEYDPFLESERLHDDGWSPTYVRHFLCHDCGERWDVP